MNTNKICSILNNFALRYIFSKSFLDGFSNWEEAQSRSLGYDTLEIIDRVDRAATQVKLGDAKYERDSVVFHDSDPNWHFLAGLYLAKSLSEKISVLDFGGSLGSTFYQHKKFLEQISNWTWGIVEQESFYKLGKTKYTEPNLNFYKNIDEFLSQGSPQFAYFGSSLQYIEDPLILIDKIENTNVEVLQIDRTPFSNSDSHIIAVQRNPKRIYSSSYPMTIFSLTKLVEKLKINWKILSIYDSIGATSYTKNGTRVEWKGIICLKKK